MRQITLRPWPEGNLTYIFYVCGRKPECPVKTHTNISRTCKLHTVGSQALQEGLKPRPSCYQSLVLTIKDRFIFQKDVKHRK